MELKVVEALVHQKTDTGIKAKAGNNRGKKAAEVARARGYEKVARCIEASAVTRMISGQRDEVTVGLDIETRAF